MTATIKLPGVEISDGDVIDPATDSCAGHCGGNAGFCWCDDLCTSYGDCCFDGDGSTWLCESV